MNEVILLYQKIILLLQALILAMTPVVIEGDFLFGGHLPPQAKVSEKHLSYNVTSSFENPDGTFTTTLTGKVKRWLDEEDNWKLVDSEFTPTTGGFEMLNASFKAFVPEFSDGIATFFNDNRYDIPTHTKFSEVPLEVTIQALGVNSVAGITQRQDIHTRNDLRDNVPYVEYVGAYNDSDLIYLMHNGAELRLDKIIRWNIVPPFCTNPAQNILRSFELTYDQDVTIEVFNQGIKKKVTREIDVDKKTGVNVKADGTTFMGASMLYAKIWDSSHLIEDEYHHNSQEIDTRIRPDSLNKYVLTKILPCSFFLDSDTVYPVYTDTAGIIKPATGSGSGSTDGRVVHDSAGSGEAYTTIRTSDGTFSADSAASGSVTALQDHATNNLWRSQQKGIFTFNTSPIGSDDVSAATINIFSNGVQTDPTGTTLDHNIYAVSLVDGQNDALANGDYNVAAWDYTTEFSTTKTFADWMENDGDKNEFILNSDGIAHITGSATIADAFGHTNVKYDGDDGTPTQNNNATSDNSFTQADFVDNAANEPELVVTHAPAEAEAADVPFWDFIYNWIPNALANK